MGVHRFAVAEYECDVCGRCFSRGGSTPTMVSPETPEGWKWLENWQVCWCDECLDALERAYDAVMEQVKAERKGINRRSDGSTAATRG